MSSLFSVVDLLVLLFCFLALQIVRGRQRRRGLPYPPGPRPLPLIGNLLDIPKDFSWLPYTEFSKKYGDVLSFHVFGQVIIVLNSVKAAKELLERRSQIYSDRPVIPIFDMMGWDWMVPSARYGEDWRRGRKLLDRGLRPGAAALYHPMQLAKTRAFLSRLLENPSEWEAHIELLQGELILAMTYGYYEVSGRNDKMIDTARKLSNLGTSIALPGASLVNHLPFLRHIPEWLPWFSYKPLIRYGYGLAVKVRNEPIQFVREGMDKGTARPSLALENLLEGDKLSGPERERANETTSAALGSLYAAGSDTTASLLINFFLAMLLYPDIVSRAQCELDAITGRERLPTFEDRPRLPFIDAVCKETLRWRPIVALIAHACTEDDVYDGYFIPKGAMVIANTWAIMHDPTLYPEPDVFKPERFIGPDGTVLEDPIVTAAFGWGKRICPGRHFVDATTFIVISSLLSVFNIEKVQDAEGRPFVYSYTGSIISRPRSFPCSITPRDKRAEELIIADTMAR